MNNRVSATLSPEELAAIKNDIAALRAKMPFLKTLTPEQKADMMKLGGKTLQFVLTALQGAQDHPELLPRSFDIDEFKRDVELYNMLQQIRLMLESLYALVYDTEMAVGGDAVEGGREVYHTFKRAPAESGVQSYVEAMSQRWATYRITQPEATEAPAS